MLDSKKSLDIGTMGEKTKKEDQKKDPLKKETPHNLSILPKQNNPEEKKLEVKEDVPKKQTDINKISIKKEAENIKKNVKVKETIDIKPIHIETLNIRERKEVKEDMQKGKIEDNKHASNLFKKFEKQLQSIPDKANGLNLTNQDKLKILVGDYNDRQKTTFTVQKDKTVQMQGPDRKITQMNNLNTEFSASQISKKQEVTKQNKTGLSV